MRANISRRAFLKGLAALAVSSGLNVPAFAKGRLPYVTSGQVVDYIGKCPGGCIGGALVKSVGEWDGVGYPVVLYKNTFVNPPETETYYDIDLSDLNKDVPKGFWRNPLNKKYPNVHTYVRMQRYGESMSEAIKHMNLASSKRWLAEL